MIEFKQIEIDGESITGKKQLEKFTRERLDEIYEYQVGDKRDSSPTKSAAVDRLWRYLNPSGKPVRSKGTKQQPEAPSVEPAQPAQAHPAQTSEEENTDMAAKKKTSKKTAPAKKAPAKKTTTKKVVAKKKAAEASQRTGAVGKILATFEKHAKAGLARKDMIAKCVDQGLNPATAATYYQKWKSGKV